MSFGLVYGKISRRLTYYTVISLSLTNVNVNVNVNEQFLYPRESCNIVTTAAP